MRRMLALLAVTCGCADMDERPVGWQIDDSEVAAPTPVDVAPNVVPNVVVPVVYEPTLILPTGECAFPSLALSELPAATFGDQASIIEGFDGAGCPTELWVNNHTNGVISLSAYMPWNPPPAYMTYRPWVDTYKTSGNVKTTERRDSYQGPLFSRVETQHDASGKVLITKTWGNDWSSESVFGTEYHETRIHPVSDLEILSEYKSSGVLQWRSRTDVDASGQPLKTFVFQNGDERLIQEWTYANGRLATTTYNQDQMRSESTYVWHADSSHTVTTLNQSQGWIDVNDYDAQGRLTRHTQDENRDGQIEYLQTKVYDALGHIVRETTSYDFVNGVATRGNDAERAYDGERLIWETVSMKGFNTQRTDYTYSGPTAAHERNKLVHYPDGKIMREISRFDALGHETLRTQDTGDDGSVEWRVERLYDGERQLSDKTISESYNPQQEWVYDEQDRLVLWLYDVDSDGVADQGTRHRYDVDGLAAYNALTPHTP